jgi:hypothetical protein
MPMDPNSDRTVHEEHRWPAVIGVLVAMAAYATLPNAFLPALRYVVVGLGVALLIPLVVINPVRFRRQTRWSRPLSIGQSLLLLAANQVALVQLVNFLIHATSADAPRLLLSALQVWVTNVIVFALVYWEIDRGGPVARSQSVHARPEGADLHFVQDEGHPTSLDPLRRPTARAPWRPSFLDYLFTSLWTSTAFSPTDAMPLSHRFKALMGLQAVAGLVLFALVVGRSVNIFA